MLDIAKIRHFYFHPPPDDPERLPSREELYAREERRAVELCLQCGDDPREDSLGEHGALIGGAGKPPRDLDQKPNSTPPCLVRASESHSDAAHSTGQSLGLLRASLRWPPRGLPEPPNRRRVGPHLSFPAYDGRRT